MAESPVSRRPRTLDPERVAEWLATHPDFFEGREGLLQQMRLPHPEARGGSVSLLERLVHDLRARTRQAEERLGELLDTARDNESRYQRLRQLALDLMDTESDDALAETLATRLSELFDITAVCLWQRDAGSEVQPPRQPLDNARAEQFERLLNGRASRCLAMPRTRWEALLPDHSWPLGADCEDLVDVTQADATRGSAVIVRLTRGECLGYLVVASAEAEQFRVGLDTLFPEYLGDVLARCLGRDSLSGHPRSSNARDDQAIQ
ncbi:DUF484 family protein [Cobetia sp. L2A1]|uniref:DUF484 family protein n=1 Tax=Cobetia sp. L2A1 TaxID=2686360 RepID=UPI00131D7768|nr:DUF484 family protein [Cobetia sp. L2A1]